MSDLTVTLPGGSEMPTIGYGTGGLNDDELVDAVRAARSVGYARFDTSEGYGNETALGKALAVDDREDVFVVSKVLPKHLHYESVIESCETSLERLDTDYLDLYLVHWPNPAISIRETMDAMAYLHTEGLVRNVGVSNFSAYQLSCAQHVSDVPIAVNQIEFHPWRQQPKIVEYCEETSVVVDAAAPVARTEIFDEPTVQDLAETYEKSPAQIVLRWAIEHGATVIPKSRSPTHLRENLALFDWALSPADRERLDELERDYSVYTLSPTDWSDEVFGISP